MVNRINSKSQLVSILFRISRENNHSKVGEPYNIDLHNRASLNFRKYTINEIKLMIEMNSIPFDLIKGNNTEFHIIDYQRHLTEEDNVNQTLSLNTEQEIIEDELDDVVLTTEIIENQVEEIMLEVEVESKFLKVVNVHQKTSLNTDQEGIEDELDDDIDLTAEMMKVQVVEEIMREVESKYISEIGHGYNVDFSIDTREDLIDNFDLTQLEDILGLVQMIESQVTNGDIDVLEIVERYKDGAIKIDSNLAEKSWWKKHFPKTLINISSDDTIESVYEKARITRDSYRRNTPEYNELFEFTNELYDEMYSSQEEVDLSEIDQDAEEFVRVAVEAIILPHHEALEKVKNSGGRVILADLWNTHFPEGLKDKVRKRDNHRCVICNEEADLHVHHKIPRKLGGIHHIHNLVTLCSSCHAVIETGDLEVAYKKCLSNYLKKKIFMQHPIELIKDVRILREEITNTLERAIFTLDNRNESELVNDLIGVLKKFEYIYNN